MIKKILLAILILGAISAAIGVYQWNKPHEKVEDMKGVAVTAVTLSKEYTENEQAADNKYLNKAIEVSGTVSEVNTNQDGGLMVVLDSGDPMTGVQCTMREKGASIAKGQNIKLKGKCSGNGITGVSLTDCIMAP
ncbi:MAG: hypothetical protein V4649_02420 [Bacteroidota bacterium]